VITGIYDLDQGAFLTGTVYFPPPVDDILEVSFLVDTGAARTCISLNDLLRLDGNTQGRIDIRPGVPLRGVGGTVANFLARAGVGFVHDDQNMSRFSMDVSLMIDASTAGLPSLLGRDILFKGDLAFEPDQGTVLFDAPVGDFELSP
jgi:hypothetical protein